MINLSNYLIAHDKLNGHFNKSVINPAGKLSALIISLVNNPVFQSDMAEYERERVADK